MRCCGCCSVNARAAFEALPVLQDIELLRNILYSGVWLRYDAAMKKLKIGRSAE